MSKTGTALVLTEKLNPKTVDTGTANTCLPNSAAGICSVMRNVKQAGQVRCPVDQTAARSDFFPVVCAHGNAESKLMIRIQVHRFQTNENIFWLG